MRLIDVNALGIGPANPDAFQEKSYANGWNAVVKMIDNAPTVDAVPVQHGKWGKVYRSGVAVNDGYVSSCCDMWNNRKSNYCPNGGAKMDAEG